MPDRLIIIFLNPTRGWKIRAIRNKITPKAPSTEWIVACPPRVC